MVVEERNCDERLVAVEQRAVSNTRRIDKLEQSNEAMLELVSSVKVLATKMDYVCKSQDELNGRLTIVEDKPAARMEQIVSAVIVALVGICIGYLFGGGF
nr:MAG TPA: hypothetical protein [Caudoviricetes sp.]